MKANIFCIVIIVLISNALFSQNTSNFLAENSLAETNTAYVDAPAPAREIDANGFDFEILDAGVNSKYSEVGSGFFRNKLIMVSSKKLGDFAKMDVNTGEAYKDLFCLDISSNGQLSLPLLFSRILNTADSEDQLAFSPNQQTVYFTRSDKGNSLEYKLYKADLEDESHGNWINIELLNINKNNVSIENPFMSPKGDKLYFSSNMEGSLGGYDLFVAHVNADGTLGTPENLGAIINTTSDEKFPSLSKDGKYLYFSSKGHENLGGFDLFVSKISNTGIYKVPRNLGNTINSSYDEVAYFLAADNKGYVSSNRPNGKGSFDIYTATNREIIQSVKGKTIDLETKIKLPNTLVILKDEDGVEIARQTTNETATYDFQVVPFETYTITTYKEGFKDGDFELLTTRNYETVYSKDLELHATEAVIAEFNKKMVISLENIYFDLAKWSIKEESLISLNKVAKVLKDNPEMKLAINAHTDSQGKDAYNLKLSDKRAASALAYLIKIGISKDRLVSKGFGESEPLVDCKTCTEEQYQKNRRIEFVILD